ncbi:MAG: nucleotidyl transferase AbiEii/AbiGii toxin family protein [Gammaproteobacteria bacterium]
MILKNEIMEKALQFGLSPNIVEKDYILSWILAGISVHSAFNSSWIFKGGTCLKKCYFEMYRFSEDLDYTLLDHSQLNASFLTPEFEHINKWIYEQTGIQITEISFEEYLNPKGNLSIEGKLGYIGPMQRKGNTPKIKLDLTCDELLVFPPEKRIVYHSYSDIPKGDLKIETYCLEEIFSEKLRALMQRLRPRDLYDVINLHNDPRFSPDQKKVREALKKKCAFKDLTPLTFEEFDRMPEKQDLISGWDEMLSHQVSNLPHYQDYWNQLPNVLTWVYST